MQQTQPGWGTRHPQAFCLPTTAKCPWQNNQGWIFYLLWIYYFPKTTSRDVRLPIRFLLFLKAPLYLTCEAQSSRLAESLCRAPGLRLVGWGATQAAATLSGFLMFFVQRVCLKEWTRSLLSTADGGYIWAVFCVICWTGGAQTKNCNPSLFGTWYLTQKHDKDVSRLIPQDGRPKKPQTLQTHVVFKVAFERKIDTFYLSLKTLKINNSVCVCVCDGTDFRRGTDCMSQRNRRP